MEPKEQDANNSGDCLSYVVKGMFDCPCGGWDRTRMVMGNFVCCLDFLE